MDVVIDAFCPFSIEDRALIAHEGTLYQHLLRCCGYPLHQPPVGALLAKQHGFTAGRWLVVSPIHWQATHNDAMITASGAALNLSEASARLMFKEIAAFLAQDGMRLIYHTDDLWLLDCGEAPPVGAARPVNQLLHQSLMPHLTSLGPDGFWQRLMTEIQMLLMSKKEKLALYEGEVNGVWFWGAGDLSAPTARPIIAETLAIVEVAKSLSSNAMLYESPKQLSKNALVWWAHAATLPAALNRYAIQWRWQDKAYQSKPSRWFYRWRKK